MSPQNWGSLLVLPQTLVLFVLPRLQVPTTNSHPQPPLHPMTRRLTVWVDRLAQEIDTSMADHTLALIMQRMALLTIKEYTKAHVPSLPCHTDTTDAPLRWGRHTSVILDPWRVICPGCINNRWRSRQPPSQRHRNTPQNGQPADTLPHNTLIYPCTIKNRPRPSHSIE